MVAERVIGICGIGLGIFLLMVLIPAQVTSQPGPINPALFPSIAAWLFILLGAIQTITSRQTTLVPKLSEISRLVVLALGIGIAALLMPYIGFLPAAISLMIMVCVMMFERRKIWLCVSIVAVPLGTWAVFVVILGRPLPQLPF